MTKYRTQSAHVLNEADDFTRELNKILAQQDHREFIRRQEEILYEEGEGWRPGDAIHRRPASQLAFMWDGTGNYIRPMIQLMDHNVFHVDRIPGGIPPMVCDKCDVAWAHSVPIEPCWSCGETGDEQDRRITGVRLVYPNRFVRSDHNSVVMYFDAPIIDIDFDIEEETRRRWITVMSDQQVMSPNEVRQFLGIPPRTSETSGWRTIRTSMDEWAPPRPEFVILNGIRIPNNVDLTPRVPELRVEIQSPFGTMEELLASVPTYSDLDQNQPITQQRRSRRIP